MVVKNMLVSVLFFVVTFYSVYFSSTLIAYNTYHEGGKITAIFVTLMVFILYICLMVPTMYKKFEMRVVQILILIMIVISFEVLQYYVLGEFFEYPLVVSLGIGTLMSAAVPSVCKGVVVENLGDHNDLLDIDEFGCPL